MGFRATVSDSIGRPTNVNPREAMNSPVLYKYVPSFAWGTYLC